MAFLHNCWYAAAWPSELDGGLLARTIVEVPMVFYRMTNGQVAALLDRCPHRLLPEVCACAVPWQA